MSTQDAIRLDRQWLRDELPKVLAVFLLVVPFTRQIQASLTWGHESWNMTEWLINYSGGFVRRGLSGEFIALISGLSHIQANFVVIAISIAVYLVALVYLLRKTRHAFPLVLMLSPVAMGAPVYEEFIVRKDVLGILLFVAALHISLSPARGIRKFVFLNLVACAAIFSHESFGFYALPALIAFNALADSSDKRKPVEQIASAFVYLLPAFAAFAGVMLFHGDAKTAVAINSHWRDLWIAIDPRGCLLEEPCIDKPWAAIDSLQWSLSRTVSLNASLLHAFSSGIYVPLAWLTTMALCYFSLLQFLKVEPGGDGQHSEKHASERARLSNILIIQLALMGPLFVVGWDFGRWIFLWTTSSIVLYSVGFDPMRIIPERLATLSVRLAGSRIFRRNPSTWLLFLFGIPGCCWTVGSFFVSSPIGYIVNVVLEATEVIHFAY